MGSSLVLGGSGQIGRFLIPKLLGNGHDVVALSRSPRNSGDRRLRWIQGDLFSSTPETGPLETIISLGPLDGLAGWLARTEFAGRPRIVALGSMSALSKRDSAHAGERALAETLHRGERELARIAQQKGLEWTLLRPTLIYGAGLDRSLSPLARLGMRWRVFPRILAASGLRQPVHADDLADACLAALRIPSARGQTFDLGGGERLRFDEMLARVRESLPNATLSVPLPIPFLRLTLHLARLLPRWRGITSQAIERLRTDLLADDRPARKRLGWSPRPFRPDAATWIPPALE